MNIFFQFNSIGKREEIKKEKNSGPVGRFSVETQKTIYEQTSTPNNKI